MSKYKEFVKNIGLFAFSNIAIKLITFLLVPLYTFYLSTAEYGVTDMLNTVVNVLIPLATLSIADATLRFCVDRSENATTYASTGFVITLLSCAVVACLLPCLDWDVFGGLGEYKTWFLACYAAMAFQTYLSNLSRGVGQVLNMMVASVVSSICTIVCAVLMIALLRWGITGFFLSLLLGNLAGDLWYLLPGRLYHYLHWDYKRFFYSIKPMLIYSLPLVPNALFWWMTQGINRLFITGMIGIGASGMFAAASKIPGLLRVVTSVFEQAWNLSAFQEFRSRNREGFFNLVYRLYNAVVILAIAILIPLLPWISSLFLQKEFYKAWLLVPILLISFYYSTLNAFYGSIYTSGMKTRYLFVTTMIGALVCVVCNYVMLSCMGLIGACVASAVGNAIVWLLRVRNSRKILCIEIKVLPTVVCHLLIINSAVIATLQLPYWQLIAVVMLIGIAILQCIELRYDFTFLWNGLRHVIHQKRKPE